MANNISGLPHNQRLHVSTNIQGKPSAPPADSKAANPRAQNNIDGTAINIRWPQKTAKDFGLDVSISEQAKRLFALMQEEKKVFSELTREFKEFSPEFTSEELKINDVNDEFHEITPEIRIGTFLRATPGTDLYEDTKGERVYQASHGVLYRSLDEAILHQFIEHISGGDSYSNDDVTGTAIRYAKLRKSLEEQYSGEELEKYLGMLEEAYDTSVDRAASYATYKERRKMERELFGSLMRLNRSGVLVGFNIENGRFKSLTINGKDVDKEILKQFNLMTSKFYDAIRESTRNFANLAKQYVTENGAAESERDINLLEEFLRKQTLPENCFAFDDLNTIKNSRDNSLNLYQNKSDNYFTTISKIFSQTFGNLGYGFTFKEFFEQLLLM